MIDNKSHQSKRKTITHSLLMSMIMSTTMSGCLPSKTKTLKVGVTAGPHAMIMEKVKEEASKKGLAIDVVEFNDFILPNVALDQGDLDANSMQHLPYLLDQNKTKGYKLVSIAKTVLMPMGLYSDKITSLAELKNNAQVAVPNDPSNEARALRVLEANGLIKLDKDIEMPSVLNITDNPKNLQIIELEAPQILRSLDDVDCALTNTDWVMVAKRDPKTAIVQEGADSPYANIIAVKESRQNEADLRKFVEIYHSQPIKDYIITEFKGAIIPLF